jgi:hypothetical protein
MITWGVSQNALSSMLNDNSLIGIGPHFGLLMK